MKKFLISIAVMFAVATASGQTLNRQGNTFSAPKTEKVTTAKCDTLDAQWEDNDGTYQIYMGRKGGLFYYKPNKDGELKKHYIPKAQANEIKDALGIKHEEEQ